MVKPNPNRGRNSSTNWLRRTTRFAILNRDAWTCAHCFAVLDASTATLDHIRPESKGGTHAATNLITACRKCNSSRADATLPRKVFLAFKRQARIPLDRDVGRQLARFERAIKGL